MVFFAVMMVFLHLEILFLGYMVHITEDVGDRVGYTLCLSANLLIAVVCDLGSAAFAIYCLVKKLRSSEKEETQTAQHQDDESV